ncbi:ABC transporter substrate-binding protein [Bifidobacterium miconisargentati]|uniref:ABC transporter substrate-binding protein n=1 Tax=Bifidobacterium miconisargentati TaxID=2834437 RepID=UPI001F407164|nr:extracellular solute-binding protein [Bifidobacterium miconisargentati]
MKNNSAMKHIVTSTAVVATLSMLLAGCSNPTASSTDVDTSSADYWPKATQSLEGTTLKMWVPQAASKIPVNMVKEFEKATGAKVDVEVIPDPYEQNVQTKVTTGDAPNLALWQPTRSMLAGFIAQDKLQKLDNAPFVDNYTEGMAEAGGLVENTRYAALFGAPSVMGVFYNKQVFEKAGITNTPKNWDELVETAKKIKAANIDGVESPFFEMGGSQWGTQYSVQVQLAEAAKDGLWDRVNTGKEKFTDKTIMTAINNYKALFDEGLENKDAGSAKNDEQAAALWNGKTGMMIGIGVMFNMVAALANNDKAALDEKIGFFPISSKGNIGTIIPDANNGVVAFKSGDNAKDAAARQLINYWLSDGYEGFVKDQSAVSVLKTVDSSPDVPEALTDSAAAIKDGVGSMQSLAIGNPDLYINLADMINGTKTPEQVGQATQDQFAQLAKAQGASGF